MADQGESIAFAACVLASGYDVGLFTKADVERWAERQIEAEAAPATELLDLAVLRRVHPLDVINLLIKLCGGLTPADWLDVRLGCIAAAYEAERISAYETANRLFDLMQEPEMSEEVCTRIFCWDEDLYQGVIELDHVPADIRRCLAPYVAKIRSADLPIPAAERDRA